MLKTIVVASFILSLNGCSSLEKTHQFKVDRRDDESRKSICNSSVEDYYEIVVVDENQFYVERATAPEWVGPPLIPFIPGALTERISEVRFTFKRKAPDIIQIWKLRFESDGLVVSPKVSGFEGIFSFPARSPSEKFELIVPGQNKPTQIQFFIETSKWTYRPFIIIFGDRFPFYQCHQ